MRSAHSFISTLEAITPQLISNLLIDSPALSAGIVTEVQVVQQINAPMSNMAYILKLAYSGDAQGKLPEQVFFKNGRMLGEVSFATHVTTVFSHPSIVECYSANFENELGQSNLVFENIQASHRFLDSHEALNEEQLKIVINTLADFHRLGWEHKELALEGRIGRNVNDLPNNLALPRAKQLLNSFFEALGNNKHKERYERIFSILPHPAWIERRNSLKNMTVVHGDVHMGNLAFSKASPGSIKLLDWSLWHIDTPTYDLAYALALRTSPDGRNHRETDLLKQYHSALGIGQYSYDHLLDDYRLSIIFHTIWPVFFHSFTPKENWLPLYENIMQTFDDWGCERLLD